MYPCTYTKGSIRCVASQVHAFILFFSYCITLFKTFLFCFQPKIIEERALPVVSLYWSKSMKISHSICTNRYFHIENFHSIFYSVRIYFVIMRWNRKKLRAIAMRWARRHQQQQKLVMKACVKTIPTFSALKKCKRFPESIWTTSLLTRIPRKQQCCLKASPLSWSLALFPLLEAISDSLYKH